MTTTAAPSIQGQINGTVSGQAAIGQYVYQISGVHGGVVNLPAPEEAVRPHPRPTPVLRRPRPFPDLLDREAETRSAVAALGAAQPVELHGEAGIGKSSLLQRLAYHEAANAFPSGVVHLHAHNRQPGDLCQKLWEAFYRCDKPYVPDHGTLVDDLQDHQALVLLDEVTLDRRSMEEVMDTAPACTFVISSERWTGPRGVRALQVGPLPGPEAEVLLERALERPLDDDERAEVATLCDAVAGNPQRLLQAAAEVRTEGLPLSRAARRAVREVLDALDQTRRAVLGALAALDGARTGTEHVAAIAGAPDAEEVLPALAKRCLVRAEDDRWACAPGITPPEAEVDAWRERALAHFTGWAEAADAEPAVVAAEADALTSVLRWAGERARWPEVIRLAKAVEKPFSLAALPDAWEQALQWLERAARETEDREAIAFALHQRGTRAACLALSPALSRGLLAEALGLREALGDHAGAAVTRHNLDVFFPGPAGPGRDDGGSRGPRRRPGRRLAVAAGGVAALILGALLLPDLPGKRGRRSVAIADTGTVWEEQAPGPVGDPTAPDPAGRTESGPVSVADEARPPATGALRVLASLDAGAVKLGTRGEQLLTLANDGPGPLEVRAVQVEGGEGEFSVAGTCGSIPPGGECAVRVAFAPRARGARSAVVRVDHGGPGGSVRVRVSGTATAGVLALSADRLAFGSRDPSEGAEEMELTLRNGGDAPLQVRAASVAGAGAADFRVVREDCTAAPVAAGGACALVVAFSPAAEGARSALLTVDSDAPEGPRTLPLAGTGVRRLTRASLGAAVGFGRVRVDDRAPASPTTRTVRVANTGTAALAVRGVGIRGQDAAEFTLVRDGCTGTVVARGGSCVVEVAFAPRTAGTRAAELRVEGNLAEPAAVALRGSGHAQRWMALDVGAQAGGTGSSSWFTVRNTGYGPRFGAVFGASATLWTSPRVGVRIQGNYLPSRLELNGRETALNTWLYDAALVVRPVPARGHPLSGTYLFAGKGGTLLDVAGDPGLGSTCVPEYLSSAICMDFETEYATTHQGVAGVGLELPELSPRLAVSVEAALHRYASPTHVLREYPGAELATDDMVWTPRLSVGVRYRLFGPRARPAAPAASIERSPSLPQPQENP
ncbi:MAG TPA: choice-of-anchor D domain-containing protein [Longimicrobium sp.]|nr:choice-of-anchor D domain-containing protein [Longimicrobium sp.]